MSSRVAPGWHDRGVDRSVSLRPATDGDRLSCLNAMARAHPDVPVRIDNPYWPKWAPEAAWMVAELDHKVVGFAWVLPLEDEGEQVAYVDVSVDPSFQCLGVGRALAAWLLEAVQGYTHAYVNPTPLTPRARDWARTLGFVETSAEGMYESWRADVAYPPALRNMSDIEIRVVGREMLGSEYASALHSLVELGWNDMPEDGTGGEPEPLTEWVDAWAENLDTGGHILVAARAGQLIGLTTCAPCLDHAGTVNMTVVVPHARGMGVATALKAHQIRVARQSGLSRLLSAIHPNNLAMQHAAAAAGWRRLELTGLSLEIGTL